MGGHLQDLRHRRALRVEFDGKSIAAGVNARQPATLLNRSDASHRPPRMPWQWGGLLPHLLSASAQRAAALVRRIPQPIEYGHLTDTIPPTIYICTHVRTRLRMKRAVARAGVDVTWYTRTHLHRRLFVQYRDGVLPIVLRLPIDLRMRPLGTNISMITSVRIQMPPTFARCRRFTSTGTCTHGGVHKISALQRLGRLMLERGCGARVDARLLYLTT